jgi:hypothetical protein
MLNSAWFLFLIIFIFIFSNDLLMNYVSLTHTMYPIKPVHSLPRLDAALKSGGKKP